MDCVSLKEYFHMAAGFALWRAVIAIGDGISSCAYIESNASILVLYASLCQESG
jgi:fructose-bisphosphate aldolase class I